MVRITEVSRRDAYYGIPAGAVMDTGTGKVSPLGIAGVWGEDHGEEDGWEYGEFLSVTGYNYYFFEAHSEEVPVENSPS